MKEWRREEERIIETKPDTRQPQSRAGGQGLYFKSLNHLGRSSEAKDRKKPKKVKCDGRTDQRTDGQTKRVVESRSTRLKSRRDEVPLVL